MASKEKPDRGRLPHSKPGSVDQQMEDTFPASDAPSFSPGAIGAPQERQSKPKTGGSHSVRDAEKKAKRAGTKKKNRR